MGRALRMPDARQVFCESKDFRPVLLRQFELLALEDLLVLVLSLFEFAKTVGNRSPGLSM
jgi:hypothetical protein